MLYTRYKVRANTMGDGGTIHYSEFPFHSRQRVQKRGSEDNTPHIVVFLHTDTLTACVRSGKVYRANKDPLRSSLLYHILLL